MSYPGTISLEPATFEALLTDICRSYKAHGFTDIILIGDSGGNQGGMRNVAEALNTKWASRDGPRALPRRVLQPGSLELRLPQDARHRADRRRGSRDRASDTRNGMHDDIYYEAQIAVTGSEAHSRRTAA